ncbi:diguanylate cyclase domain-containing protein [Niveibacterium terrae]|uniref:diguanylate cyclase domain-containing protein n=1 Tax=Niveibacterium terrae TaxID=3373598 RepID=UPI003A903F20
MSPGSRQIRQRVIVALVIFQSSMLLFVAYILFHSRQDSLRAATDIAALHTRSFEDFVTRTLQVTDLVAASVLEKRRHGAPTTTLGETLKASLLHTPFIRSVSLVSGSGMIVASSNRDNFGVVVDLTPFFPRTSRSESFRIGVPQAGRDFSDARAGADPRSGFIPVVRSLGAELKGQALLIALNPDYFVGHFNHGIEGGPAVVEWLRYDGVSLIDTREDRIPGAREASVLARLGLPEREFGTQVLSEQGRQYITAFRASSLYPFVLLTRIDKSAALAPLRREAITLAAVVLPTLILVTLFALIHIRRHVQLEEQREQSARLARVNAASVFTNAREGIIIASPDGSFDEVNAAFSAITGYAREEAVGQTLKLLRPLKHHEVVYDSLLAEANGNGQWSGEIWGRRKDGSEFAALLTIGAVKDEGGRTRQFVMLFSNITSLKEHEEKLLRIAYNDTLTGLPNRVLLADRLAQGMAQARRRGQKLAVAFVDLDGFKQVNDRHGHEAGDELLRVVAARMKEVLREGDTLARLGGDEFVAVLLDQGDLETLDAILKRLLAAAAQAVQWEDADLRVSASIGVVIYPADPEDKVLEADQLLRSADQAMYRAKLAGKGKYLLHGSS